MIPYTRKPDRIREDGEVRVACFFGAENVDDRSVAAHGSEWDKFGHFSEEEIRVAGDQYFDVVPPRLLTTSAAVLDAGCGSGRWSRYVAPLVGQVEAIDPSAAAFTAATQHKDQANVRFTQAAIDVIPFADESFDLAICLGVLHHIPDTAQALRALTKKVRPGGHLLLYLYYSLDNRGAGYRFLFGVSNVLRRVVSALPSTLKKAVCEVVAATVYLPLVTLSRTVDLFSPSLAEALPLAYYRDKSLRTMSNDALDRFGTPLEKRFSKREIEAMLVDAGMEQIHFSEYAPFWHCLSRRTQPTGSTY